MEKHYRMVIDLYKQALTEIKNGSKMDPEAIFTAKETLAKAETEAKILGKPIDEFTQLIADVDNIKSVFV